MSDDTCSSCSLAHEEDPGGSASRQRFWLLVEQPGAWGRNALLESKLPAAVSTELEQRRRAANVRVLLIRRGPGVEVPDDRRWAFVRATPEAPAMGGGTFRDPEELLDLDLAALTDLSTPLPGTLGEPLLAVCTHGRHDRCCADNGRPVARHLRQSGADAWECSHVGGDRFAANVVSFPHGLFHGRVTPASALPLLHTYQHGQIHPAGFRGRGAYSPAAQQAEIVLRHQLDDWHVDSLRLGPHTREDDRHTLAFTSTDGREHVVVIDVGLAEEPRLLSCGNQKLGQPRTFSVVDVRLG
ncbi:MAG TPA: sucrase ferredoxin [Acidimicrobiales bacterium]|nr:sucrase ferredoxin [Acidimicrobiales bacterium]